MHINNFELERYFAKHEFETEYLLSCSDCDGYSLKYVLEQANESELKLWNELTLGYTESQGHPALRQSISHLYEDMSPDNVLVMSPGELNFAFMHAFLKRGDHVISILPAYQSLYEVAHTIGCDVSFWEPDPAKWYFDPSDLKNLIKTNTKLLILNFPNNPTGAMPSMDDMNEIIAIARKHGLFIFSDEMYARLTIREGHELPPMTDVYERAFSLWGVSKSFGLAGLRIGWLVGRDQPILETIQGIRDYLSICNSAPSEILSLIALNHKEAFIKPNVKKIQTNLSLFEDYVETRTNLFEFAGPKAGSVGFVKCKLKEPTLSFSERMVRQSGVMTVPSEMFGYRSGYLRIGLGRRNFSEVLKKFDAFITGD